MLCGAAAGDILGSLYEFQPWGGAPEALEIFPEKAWPTDDTVLTCAVADALARCALPGGGVDAERFRTEVTESLRRFALEHTGAGYGGRFMRWLLSYDPRPYGSLGNGSAMRASGCAWAATSMEEALELARLSALPTHNHPQGVAGARCAVWLIRRFIENARPEDIRVEWDALWRESLGPLPDPAALEAARPIPTDPTCAGTVPIAAAIVLDSGSLEETIRRAVALGGDCDTIAAIAGAAAEAAFGVPPEIERKTLERLPEDLVRALADFDAAFGRPRAGAAPASDGH